MSKIIVPPGFKLIECPQCGGYGGEPGSNFGDYGWHSCYKCGELGMIIVLESYGTEPELPLEPEPLS